MPVCAFSVAIYATIGTCCGRRNVDDAVGEAQPMPEDGHRHRGCRRVGHVDQRQDRGPAGKCGPDPFTAAADVNHRRTTRLGHLRHAPAPECRSQARRPWRRRRDRGRHERDAMTDPAKMTQRPEAGAMVETDEQAGPGGNRIARDRHMAIHPPVTPRRRYRRIDLIDDAHQPVLRRPRRFIGDEAEFGADAKRIRGLVAEERLVARESAQQAPRDRPRQRRGDHRQQRALGELSQRPIAIRAKPPSGIVSGEMHVARDRTRQGYRRDRRAHRAWPRFQAGTRQRRAIRPPRPEASSTASDA